MVQHFPAPAKKSSKKGNFFQSLQVQSKPRGFLHVGEWDAAEFVDLAAEFPEGLVGRRERAVFRPGFIVPPFQSSCSGQSSVRSGTAGRLALF
jgi:hypothetical protein